jgi:hypothetical protein
MSSVTTTYPWLGLEVLNAGPAWTRALTLCDVAGTVGRLLRGIRMMTYDAMYAEMAAALQFPPGYATNPNVFNEYMADLDWLDADTYELVVCDAHLLFRDDRQGVNPGPGRGITADDPHSTLKWWLSSLESAVHQLSVEPDLRPPADLRVTLCFNTEAELQQFTEILG